jgi:diguanylate cyclase (GGDEF)-like protein
LRDEPTAYETVIARCKAAERLGGYAEAAKFAREAQAIAAAQNRPDAQAFALRLLANQLSRTGANEEAARACERAVSLFEAADAEAELPETLTDLTLIYVMLGLHEEALEAVTRGMTIAQRLNDTRLLYWAHNRTGVVRNSMGDVKAADAVMRTALDLAEQLGPAERYCILNNLADNAHELVVQCREAGNTAQAATALAQGLAFAEAALALVEDGTRPYQEALTLGNYGFLLALDGKFDAAAAALARSAEIAMAQDYASLAVTTGHFAGRVALLRGETADGIERLRDVMAQAEAAGEKQTVAKLNRQLSEAYASIGDAARALAHFKAFYTLELEINNNVAQTRARLLSNMVELENSRIEAERSRLEAAALRAQSAGLEAEKRALQAKADELGRAAHEDALTGLWNRRYIDTVLEPLFGRMTRTSRPPCVALCDIDHFKSINDRFGHAAGDAVLTKVAALLLRGARQSDIVARFGGEEFLIIFAESDLPAARLACERLRAAIEACRWDTGLTVTISIGVVPADTSASLPSTVQAADKMLYRAKQNGRNRVESGTG